MIEDPREYNIIYSYTEKDAIDDGVLVYPYPHRFPSILVTRSIHSDCKKEEEQGGRSYNQCLIPLMLDCMMAVESESDKKEPEFPVVIDGTLAGTVWVMPNGLQGETPNGLGGFTILKPEDY